MLDVGLLVLVQVDLVQPRPVEPHALPLAHDLGGVDLKHGSSLRFGMLVKEVIILVAVCCGIFAMEDAAI